MKKVLIIFLLLFFSLNCYAKEVKNNEQKFWKKYKIENDEYLHTIKYYPKEYNILPIKLVLTKEQNNKIKITMNLKITYFADSYLNINSLIFKNSDNYTISAFKNKDFSVIGCRAGGCRYYEYMITDISLKDLKQLQEIAKLKNADYRAYGQHYYKDFKLGILEKEALIDMINLYDYLSQ